MAVWLTIYLISDSSPPKAHSPNQLTHCSPKTPVSPSYFYSCHSIHLECPYFPLPFQILLICFTICSPNTSHTMISLSPLNSNSNEFYITWLVINHMLLYDSLSIVTLNCYLIFNFNITISICLSYFHNWNIRSSKAGGILYNCISLCTWYGVDLLIFGGFFFLVFFFFVWPIAQPKWSSFIQLLWQ